MTTSYPGYPYGFGGKPAEPEPSPLGRLVPPFKLTAVGPTPIGTKQFLLDSTAHLTKQYVVLLIMDGCLNEEEAWQWLHFSAHLPEFEECDVNLLGVATMGPPSLRHHYEDAMKGMKFPCVVDDEFKFSQSLGVVLHDSREAVDIARSLVVLGPQRQILHIAVHKETEFSQPAEVLELIRQLHNQLLASSACCPGEEKEMDTAAAAGAVQEEQTCAKKKDRISLLTKIFSKEKKPAEPERTKTKPAEPELTKNKPAASKK